MPCDCVSTKAFPSETISLRSRLPDVLRWTFFLLFSFCLFTNRFMNMDVAWCIYKCLHLHPRQAYSPCPPLENAFLVAALCSHRKGKKSINRFSLLFRRPSRRRHNKLPSVGVVAGKRGKWKKHKQTKFRLFSVDSCTTFIDSTHPHLEVLIHCYQVSPYRSCVFRAGAVFIVIRFWYRRLHYWLDDSRCFKTERRG